MRRAMVVAVLALCCGAAGCTPKQPPPPPPGVVPALEPVAMKTVPPGTPTPSGGAALPTRPVMKAAEAEAAKRQGKAIGPVVNFLGAARADGQLVDFTGKNAQGIPVYRNQVGSGFILVVEGKAGIGNIEVGRSIFRYDPNDPTQRPDLEIEVDRALGDGSATVCDARKPKIGGIPAVNPLSFAETAKISSALNDFSCRFETFIESSGACTVKKTGDFTFAKPDSTVQFCMVVARAWAFQDGQTKVSVRLRDVEGNPGPISHLIIDRRDAPPTPVRAAPSPTPTAPRRRQ